MELSLKSIGLTKEELQKRVIDKICADMLVMSFYDEDGEEGTTKSRFATKLTKAINERIDKSIAEIAEKHVLPNASKYIEEITFQETTKWGEKTGKPVSFREYLASRAESYLTEKVNYIGKAKGEDNYSSWSGTQTRLTFLVHEHLHYSIETAMKKAVASANEVIAAGLAETCKIKLEEITKALQVTVKTK